MTDFSRRKHSTNGSTRPVPNDSSHAVVIKHHCTQGEISDEPDYVVCVPSLLEGFEVRVLFTPEDVFIVHQPSEQTHRARPETSASIFQLDMETGKQTFVQCCAEGTIPINLWQDGPSLYVWGYSPYAPPYTNGRFLCEWDTLDSMAHQHIKLPKEPHIDMRDPDRRVGFDGICIKGYVLYSDHKVVDLRNRRVYEVPYEGKCLTVGLLDGELHWWMFPEADKRVKLIRHINEPVDLCEAVGSIDAADLLQIDTTPSTFDTAL